MTFTARTYKIKCHLNYVVFMSVVENNQLLVKMLKIVL